jgi:hypothetical protein
VTKHAATAAATDTQSAARTSLSAPVHKRPYDSLRSENQYHESGEWSYRGRSYRRAISLAEAWPAPQRRQRTPLRCPPQHADRGQWLDARRCTVKHARHQA